MLDDGGQNDERQTIQLQSQINVEKRENAQLHERILMINQQKKENSDQVDFAASTVIHQDQASKRIQIEINHKDDDCGVMMR